MKLATLLRSHRAGAHPPITVEDAQHMLDRVSTMTYEGSDGGFSTVDADGSGRARFWFGDSVTRYGFRHSSILVQRDGLMRPQDNQIIPNEGSTRYWPAHAARLDDGTYLVPCGGIIPTPGWFIVVDSKMAICRHDETGRVVFDRWLPGTINERDGDDPGPNWNSLVRGDGDVLHLFSVQRDPAEPTNPRTGVFHRTASLADPTNKSLWGPVTQIVPFETDGSWSPWRDDDGVYRAVSMDVSRRHVRVYTALDPVGPWTAAQHDDVVPRDDTPGENVYVLHAHPWMHMVGEPAPTLACTVSHSVPAQHAEGKHEYRIRWLGVPQP